MDIAVTAVKIADITIKIKDFYDKMICVYNKMAKKINKYIEDIENILNNTATRSNMWIDTQLKKITVKMQECINGFKKSLDNMFNAVKSWYNNTVMKFKITFIKASLAKIGTSASDEMAEAFASIIPHPELSSLIQLPNVDISVPDPSSLLRLELSNLKKISLI